MRARVGIVVTVVALATLGLTVGGTAAAGAASTPSITVVPSVQLEDGQVVTIVGNGFLDTPLSAGWRAIQCDSGILDGPIEQLLIAHCDPNGPPGVTATAGEVRIDFTVHRTIHVGEEGRAVTCGTVSGDCALLVVSGTTTGGVVGAAAPISFLGDHTVTVTPHTGLRDGQVVTVSGTGFVEHPVLDKWVVLMCSPAGVATPLSLQNTVAHCDVLNEPGTSVAARPDGTLGTPFTVHETFATPSGPVTCGQAPNDCSVLVAYVTTTGFVGASAPISFAPPVPTLRDCIRTFLADHQHRPASKLHRLLVCIFTALTHPRR
jgi:hypothetical protein